MKMLYDHSALGGDDDADFIIPEQNASLREPQHNNDRRTRAVKLASQTAVELGKRGTHTRPEGVSKAKDLTS